MKHCIGMQLTVLTNHHIVLDGWSMPILLAEIFAGYHRASGNTR